jgi:hypothetical protein
MNRRELIKAMLAAPALALLPAVASPTPVLNPPLPGKFIWFGGLNEVSTRVGETVSYAYDADFAVDICEGPVQGVQRIWADDRCIYDIRPRQANESDAAYAERHALTAEIDQHLTVYLGTEMQQASPLIESYLGVGNAPAFRGRHYITLQQFPVEQYGNRVPRFAVETR